MGLKQDVYKWQANFVFMTSVLFDSSLLASLSAGLLLRHKIIVTGIRRRNLKPNDVQLSVHEYKHTKQNQLQNMKKLKGAFKSSEEESSI